MADIIKLVSLDVTSLFTNVPTDDVIDFISRKVDNREISLPIPKKPFIEFIKLCVDNNTFQYENNFFRQKFGIAMGSPLSPILANLYMEMFESELLPTISPAPVAWFRYVDDILAVWPDDLNFDEFFRKVNKLSPSIEFTTEWEVEGKIPFLDTQINRSPAGFNFSIYRKPTHSNQYIHWFSWHPDHVKRSSLFSLFLRAYRVCDHPHLQPELDFIRKAFENSGFPRNVIESVHTGVKQKFFNPRPPTSDGSPRKPVISLPFNRFSKEYVSPIFRNNGFQVVNKAGNTIKSQLVCNRPPRNDDPSSAVGVYRIPCKNCEKSYYGQTGREFKVRLKEHKDGFRTGKLNNACWIHHSKSLHDIDWSNSKIIHKTNNYYERLVVESSLINTMPNINQMKSTLAIDAHSSAIILESMPNLRKVRE